jgi:hypothetical protein
MNCIICGESVGLSGTKLKNGKICKTCTSKLPSLMLDGAPYLQEHTMRHAITYVGEKLEKFDATASYGQLHIDEIHGLFAISDGLTKTDKPKSGNNVFSIYDLTEIGLYCTSPRTDRGNVLVDVEFKCVINSPRIAFKKIIKKGVHCKIKRVDSQHVEWEEPADMSMFRTLFNQMLTSALERINTMLCGKTVHQCELEHAKAVMMVPDNYTKEDLKKSRRLLMKVYHPDRARDDDVTRESQIINNAYDLLNAELERMDQG